MEYLLLAVVLMAAGIAIVIARNRRPTGADASISEFEESLDAIAPPADESRGRRSG
ncbi:MAG TPA: hypothetical protein VFF40_02995 [Acidimicrobiia bacterium]|nr:hypothetical protein [Acidimicrobiia bacterium]